MEPLHPRLQAFLACRHRALILCDSTHELSGYKMRSCISCNRLSQFSTELAFARKGLVSRRCGEHDLAGFSLHKMANDSIAPRGTKPTNQVCEDAASPQALKRVLL